MSTQLYFAPQLPGRWIAEHEGALVMWPTERNGWAARQPYRGHRAALAPCAAYNAYGTGWPGAPDARP